MNNPRNAQVVRHIISGAPGFGPRYITNYDNLSEVVHTLKSAGYRIVLTQGVYDLFHVGHKRYLEEAKGFGDILIVGVDTDELTKKRKGPKRPFDKLTDRVEILSGLRSVDLITIRNEHDHMYRLIKVVQPHVLVMSKTTEDFTEKDRKNLLQYCGDIKVLPAKAGTTTTAKLRKLMIEGVAQLGQKINSVINQFLGGIDNESSSSLHPGSPQGTQGVQSKGKTGYSVYPRK
jgi:rfaE bifunctional protein nucleotidyltransferase chain/domain